MTYDNAAAANPPVVDFHARSAQSSLGALDATREGLRSGEAARRLAIYGPNRLPEPPSRGPLIRFP